MIIRDLLKLIAGRQQVKVASNQPGHSLRFQAAENAVDHGYLLVHGIAAAGPGVEVRIEHRQRLSVAHREMGFQNGPFENKLAGERIFGH